MKSNLLVALFFFCTFFSVNAQLSNGTIAPDFTLTDMNGYEHSLYQDYLDQGYTVFIDFSAVWCPPCWSYHTSGALEDLYVNHGPAGFPNVSASTTNDVMVIFIEGDGSSETCIEGSGCGTHGDWTDGTPYPIISTDGTPNNTSVVSAYDISYWPTVYQVCPDRTLTLCGTTASPYSLVTACLPPPSQNNDARSFMNSSSSSGCSSSTPEISIQNYGLNSLTEVNIEVSLNGVSQSSTIFNQIWNNLTNSYQPLNLSTLDVIDVELDPVTGLSNGDVITIDVSMPNGTFDTDPLNNQTISYVVDLGFDNAYWDGPLTIDVAGGPQNSWYLKQVSTNQIIASGFGGVTGATNSFPLVFDECYTLQSINGANLPYTVVDAQNQIVLSGSATGAEDFDNFTTGAQVWVGVNEQIFSAVTVYPNPVSDKLYIEGIYDHLRVVDLLGKEVLYSTYTESVDVSGLNNGMYLMEVIYDAKTYYQNIQIVH